MYASSPQSESLEQATLEEGLRVSYKTMFATTSQLCRAARKGLSWLVAENDDMSFFQLFQYCLGSGLGTIGDFSSDQLLHDPNKRTGKGKNM